MVLPTIGSLAELSDVQRFELLVRSVTDCAMYLLDPDGHIVSWNAGGQKVFGYTADEVIGRHFSRFFSAEEQAAGVPARILDAARTASRCEVEGWRFGKDGRRFRAAVVIHAITNSSGGLLGFANVTRDVTQRREAEEALRQSDRQFRLLVEGVADYAIYMLDPAGTVISWNTGAERLKGYAATEIIGQNFARFYTEQDRAAGVPQRVLQAAARDGEFESEGWRVRKDGSRFWALAVVDAIRDEGGELLGFAKVTRDITERQISQEALRDSERQFRLLIEGVKDHALFMLDADGVVSSWNAGAERLEGYTADEILGRHFSVFYTDSDRAAGVPARLLRAAERDGRVEHEGWRVRKDGSLFWGNGVINALREENGGLIGFAKITRDITERRETQEALQKAQAQRSYAQKMEALGQLTGGIAHDFNNLLMIVSGHLETINRLVAHDPKGQRAAQAVEVTVSRGESLTRQLLSFARRQALKPVTVGLPERIEAVATMLASPLGTSARLVTDIPDDIWPVTVDISEFELALVNLALNSRDAMPEGGVITISAANARLTGIDTPAELAGEFVALSIADTGCGIAPDILPKVFDPFFTTKQGRHGTGLGLSQVHGFAHQSGGTVTIDSKLGKGTRTTLYLPRAQSAPEQSRPAAAAETEGNGTVLLVEDNPDVREVTVALLEQLGYQAQAVGNAEAALAAIGQHGFDLMVSDIVMAGVMDGLALAREVRRRNPDLPIVLVTGYSDSAAAAQREFTVLRKPYRLAELSRAVARVVGEARQPSGGNLVRLSDARRATK
jgi:PAS domain S-box-containing protein